jgi:GNAT superfamily N-acetyltransferase
MGKVTSNEGEIEVGGALTPPTHLSTACNLESFNCGKPPLDEWLQKRAFRAEGETARTYVVCIGTVVVGYYCLATGAVVRDNLPGKLRRNAPDPVPLLVIGRLAVDRNYQGRGIGKGLLKDALLRSAQAAEIVGTRAVMVQAFDDEVSSFYRNYGFLEFPLSSRTFYLPIDTLVR